MPDDPIASTATPDAADAADGGWTVESNSVPVELAPEDTTAKAQGATDAYGAAGNEKEGIGDEEPAGSAAVAPPAASASTPAKNKGKTLNERKASLTKEIDALTYRKHETDRQFQESAARLAKLRGELVEGESKLPGKGPAAPATAVASVARPKHPKYQDFETDELYNAAVATWETADQQWLEARETALKTDITTGLDARLQREREMSAARVAQDELVGRLEAAREAHADWDEKAGVLADLRSSWVDPSSDLKTPFLSDIGQNTPDGPEFLYWLATHPTEAQALADLQPTQPLRDAIIIASSPHQLMEHFATLEGQREFQRLKGMHPGQMFQMVGALSARLAAAPGGPTAAAPHPITAAVPSAKPPVGAPRARTDSGSGASPGSFEEFMAAEDAKEKAAKLQP